MSPRRTKSEHFVLPMLVRRDVVVFPRVSGQLLVLRPQFQRAVDAAVEGDRRIVVVGRMNRDEQEFGADDLCTIGTLAQVGRIMRLPDGAMSVGLEGVQRVAVMRLVAEEPYYVGQVTPIGSLPSKGGKTAEAARRVAMSMMTDAVKLSHHMDEDDLIAALNAEDIGELADQIANSLHLPVEDAQSVLETLNPDQRMLDVQTHLASELEVLRLQTRMQSAVQEEVERTQREHILREHLRMIQEQLRDVDPAHKQLHDLQARIESAGMPKEVRERAFEEMERLASIPVMSPESTVLRNYLDWLVNLPWATSTEDNLDLGHAATVLDKNHYGLEKVKERLLEYMAVRKLAGGGMRSPVLCLVGPPGVGKTSLGRSVAEALGRRFARVSLGGVRDEAEVRGHRRTYVGALPGRIVQAMKQAGVVNPVFMLDELDKMGADFRGDPSSALLEVLDPEQNHAFSDHYLEVSYDLSRVLFIATANVLDPVMPALQDRLEVIELPGYTEEEKIHIAQRFLAPRQAQENGLGKRRLQWDDDTLRQLIRGHTHEAGVRNLEREMASVYRKTAKAVADGRRPGSRVTVAALDKALGPARFSWGAAEERDEVGVATGVARTAVGGDVLSVEVSVVEGKGDLTLTGSLGDVMKESAQAALSFARSRSQTYHLPPKVFEQRNIHIHVPAGAVPKDGPSAGVTLATALVSALRGHPVRRDVAMTGEVTLRGRVLDVGGIKEKVLAAHRAGITTFVLPKRNRRDLEDVPAQVRDALTFVPVETMDEVLAVALAPRAMAEG